MDVCSQLHSGIHLHIEVTFFLMVCAKDETKYFGVTKEMVDIQVSSKEKVLKWCRKESKS